MCRKVDGPALAGGEGPMPPSGIATVRKRPAPFRKHGEVEGVWASLEECSQRSMLRAPREQAGGGRVSRQILHSKEREATRDRPYSPWHGHPPNPETTPVSGSTAVDFGGYSQYA